MSNYNTYTVSLLTLADDLQATFTAQQQSSDPKAAMLIEIQGSGRLAKDFADLLVVSINKSPVSVMALVRNDLLIQFLVSSINLRCSQTEVKAFKTFQAAEDWLLA
ncbi:MAG: hypothetical protein AAF821_17875 [Cyanobacteria bacterium P01_D01_bin.156]